MKHAPHTVRSILIGDIITLVVLILALAGVIIPLFVVPPYPISDARILAGTIAVPIVGTLLLLNILSIIGLLRGSVVGKAVQSLFSFLMLFAFPLGTILHGWILYELYSKEETYKYFERTI